MPCVGSQAQEEAAETLIYSSVTRTLACNSVRVTKRCLQVPNAGCGRPTLAQPHCLPRNTVLSCAPRMLLHSIKNIPVFQMLARFSRGRQGCRIDVPHHAKCSFSQIVDSKHQDTVKFKVSIDSPSREFNQLCIQLTRRSIP